MEVKAMGKGLSIDLRRRIVAAYHAGEGSIRSLAARFAVAVPTVQNYLTLQRTTGDLVPRPRGGGRPATLGSAHKVLLRTILNAYPDATLAELCDHVVARGGPVVHFTTMGTTLARLGITRKKSLSSPPKARRPSSRPRAVASAGRSAR